MPPLILAIRKKNMTSVDWIGFTVASVAVVLAPGPGSVFVAKTAGSRGARAGRGAMLGIMLGDTCLIVLSLLGVSALFNAHTALFHAVRLIGAGYLIFLGLQSIFAKQKEKSAVPQDSVLSLRRALTITLLNRSDSLRLERENTGKETGSLVFVSQSSGNVSENIAQYLWKIP